MRVLRGTLSFLFLALFAALPATARDLVFQHFDAQIYVRADGTIDVTETMETQFIGSWHGIYRTIPVEYSDPHGLNYTLFIEDVSATDDTGQKLKLEQNREGRYVKFKIYVPAAEDATRTITLHYRVLDAMRFFADHDELYWNVTGDEWQNAIDLVTARIELPEGVTGLRAIAYTGVFGSHAQDAQVEVGSNYVQIRSTRRLGYRQGLTAVVGFDKGFVQPPSAGEQFTRFLRSNLPLFIPVIAFFVMLWLWWTRGRDPARNAISVQYEPPDKLTPGECGTLVDNEAAMRDITATLVDLAVKGYMTIEQIDESHLLGLTHSKEYIFHLKKPPGEWDSARPHEQEMLSALFDAGATTDVKLSDLQNHFYKCLPMIRDRIFSALMSDGYYLHRPDTVKQGYMGVGILIGFLMTAGTRFLSAITGIASGTWVIAGLATGAVIAIFGWFMSARTITGARALEKVLGFEEFLGRVEKDQIERLQKTPELFEKFLPYAMALQVEKKWVQAFSGIAVQPPQWYQGSYGSSFTPYFLVNDLNMMSAHAGSVMASAPRSSGGSGFGGGGGSGGGFGGGGGGGF
ncbi:MAG TPA: DUF2207 domain-containing protein [Candidatus Acidoferrales bacterium]|jgi:uncharacterized membrane protein|nr:DUF2207 domain-containing protein [Candidatus Acidoferrales bacterium]